MLAFLSFGSAMAATSSRAGPLVTRTGHRRPASPRARCHRRSPHEARFRLAGEGDGDLSFCVRP